MTSSLPSPAVEPITCQSWCQDRDGHPTERVHEDPVSYTHLTLPTIYSV